MRRRGRGGAEEGRRRGGGRAEEWLRKGGGVRRRSGKE